MIDYRCSPYNAPVDGVWLAIGVLLFNRPLNYSLPINEHWSTANPRTQTFYAAEIANTCWFSGSPQSTITDHNLYLTGPWSQLGIYD